MTVYYTHLDVYKRQIQGQDDYHSLEEVLTRRFTHGQREQKELEEKNIDRSMGSFSIFPDLILMDGGKGQVHIAQKVLMELGLDIPVCGMVKDDFHRTRGIYFEDEEIAIERNSEAFRLVTRIQDEAHRLSPIHLLLKCLSAWVHPGSEICLKRLRRQRRVSSLSMSWMPLAKAGIPDMAAMMSGSRH